MNIISNGLSCLGTIYLWAYPIGVIRSQIFPIFRTVSDSDTFGGPFDKDFNDRITNMFDEFLSKMNLKNGLSIYQNYTGNIMGAISTLKDRAIVVVPGLIDTDQDAFSFCFKHELSHIRDNDTLKMAVIYSVFHVSSMLYLRHYADLSFIPAAVSYMFLTKCFEKITGTYFERKADNFAINNSSPDELKGALRLYNAEETVSSNSKIPFLSWALSTHPTPLYRNQAVRAALKRSNIEYNPDSNDIAPLVEFLKKNQAECTFKILSNATQRYSKVV